MVYGCCFCWCCVVGGCLAAGAPRSSRLRSKLLVSGYWLLSKGIWWTLWTCVFRFPFWDARYGQSWQQNGLSPAEHTHNAQIRFKAYGEVKEDAMHSTRLLEKFLHIEDLIRQTDVNHWRDLLQVEKKKKNGTSKYTDKQAQTQDGIQLEIQKHYVGQKQHSCLIFHT